MRDNIPVMILKTIFVIPFLIAVLIMATYLIMGTGIILPYMVIYDEYGFGFFRTLIFGTLFHIVVIGIVVLGDNLMGDDWENYAWPVLIVGMILLFGLVTNFSW